MLLTKKNQDHKVFADFPAFRIPSLFDDILTEEGLTARDRWAPPMDVSETEAEYKVRLETPGMAKDDIKIELENSVLTVSGEKNFGQEYEKEKCYRVERRYGAFSRSLRFTDIDPGKVTAHYENGVLEVAVTKAEAAKPKKIEIK